MSCKQATAENLRKVMKRCEQIYCFEGKGFDPKEQTLQEYINQCFNQAYEEVMLQPETKKCEERRCRECHDFPSDVGGCCCTCHKPFEKSEKCEEKCGECRHGSWFGAMDGVCSCPCHQKEEKPKCEERCCCTKESCPLLKPFVYGINVIGKDRCPCPCHTSKEEVQQCVCCKGPRTDDCAYTCHCKPEEPKPDYCGCEDPSWVPSQFIGLFCTNCKRYVNPLNEPKEPEKCEHTYKYDKKYRWYWCEFCEQPMPHDYYTREEIDNKEYLGREYTDRAILQWRDEEKAFRTELLDCLYEFCGSKEVKALRKKFL